MKVFQSYREQLDLLASRGMIVRDVDLATSRLAQVNYYRLSGYWYPFRSVVDGRRTDSFVPGSSLEDVFALYDFDERLRSAVFSALAPVELAVGTAVGHGLGRLDPCAHLRPDLLGPLAQRGGDHAKWQNRHLAEVERSREDFVEHHRSAYGGRLPVWAAVEVMDWGALTWLFALAPSAVQHEIARAFGLTPPQLHSWLRALNIVRNACAHHGRFVNRVWSKRPRLPRPGVRPELDDVAAVMNRTFGQLTLVQFLRRERGLGPATSLTAALATFPVIERVPSRVMGLPGDGELSSLWI